MRTLLIAAVLGSAASAARFDPPDLALELEMHKRFASGTLEAEGTPILAPDAYVESHRIGAGETLWSLSRVLYGDGAYWPRVWAQNHSITNPHLVQPGHVLEFLMGTEDDAPAFRFSEEGPEGGVELTAANLTTSATGPGIEIPPPEVAPRPVLRVPPSFPEWQSVYKRQPKNLINERLNLNRAQRSSRAFLRAWVDEKEPESIGQMLETDAEAEMPSVNQYVFVKVKRGTAQTGAKLLVVQNAGKLRRTTDTFEDERDAFLVQVSAEVELTEQVPGKFDRRRDREEFEAWRALVTRTTNLSTKDCVLIPGALQFVDVTPSGPHGSGTAQIVGSERNTASQLYGGGDLVFLDRGTSAGIANGQIYDVFADRRTRRAGTPVVYSPAPSGRVKIVRVSENLATAVVLSAHDSILQGDRIRAIGSHEELAASPVVSSRLPAADDGDDLELGDPPPATDDQPIDGDLSSELDQ